MNRKYCITATLLAIALTVAACSHRPPSDLNRCAGWTTLLEPTEASLASWNLVGDANWHVYRGAVVANARKSKAGSFLVTKGNYGDFQLRVEFWASHDANSGIYMRCADRKKITDRSCYEANIFDQRADPLYGTGAIVHLAHVHPMPKAGGRWNTFEITARGNRISVWLNGEPTVDLVHDQLKNGPIALQYAGGEIRFRKVLIRPL
jgi:hypothetical protein